LKSTTEELLTTLLSAGRAHSFTTSPEETRSTSQVLPVSEEVFRDLLRLPLLLLLPELPLLLERQQLLNPPEPRQLVEEPVEHQAPSLRLLKLRWKR
jgi:hypothetical protein